MGFGAIEDSGHSIQKLNVPEGGLNTGAKPWN